MGKPQALELWQRYYVPDIAAFFGEEYKQNVWRTGMKALPEKKIMILLANVSTQELQYPNEFLSASRLKWFSQNQTRQEGKTRSDHQRDRRARCASVHSPREYCERKGQSVHLLWAAEVCRLDRRETDRSDLGLAGSRPARTLGRAWNSR